jgi:hypothetical protein
VLKDKVICLVLQKPLDLKGPESSHKLWVPPELKVIVLTDNTGSRDLVSLDLRDTTKDVTEEWLIPHEINQVRVKFKCSNLSVRCGGDGCDVGGG